MKFSSNLSQSSAVDLKTKEEKDAELDRRIEALRKKNEALVKRYQVMCVFCAEQNTNSQLFLIYLL